MCRRIRRSYTDMQDITGHFALPLVAPFSDVPPPYGRCSSALEKIREPGPRVFDLYPHGVSREQVKASAADFGSGNAPWRRHRPARHSWRRTLAVGLAFAAPCCVATHMLESGDAHPSPDSVYRGMISVASMQQSAPARIPVAEDVNRGAGSLAMPDYETSHRDPVRNAAVPTTATKFYNPGWHATVRAVPKSERSKARHAVPMDDVAEGLDMTDAEFTYWREATRDHQLHRETRSKRGEWYFNSVDHPRLIPY